MSYVYAGTRLTWVGTWNETGVLVWVSGVSDILAQVNAYLQNNYSLRVERSNVQAPSVAVGSLTEVITLNLYSQIDRNDDSDILGNLVEAFSLYGAAPDSSDFTSIKPPNAAAQDTGAPLPDPTAGSSPTGSWWNNAVGKIEAGSVGVIVGVVAVVGLSLYLAVREGV